MGLSCDSLCTRRVQNRDNQIYEKFFLGFMNAGPELKKRKTSPKVVIQEKKKISLKAVIQEKKK